MTEPNPCPLPYEGRGTFGAVFQQRSSNLSRSHKSNLARACRLIGRRKPGEVAARHSCRAAGEGAAQCLHRC